MLNKILTRYTIRGEGEFCVYVTEYAGKLLPPLYIGHTKTQKIAQGYNGSVLSKEFKTIWKREREEHPEFFATHVLSCHGTRIEAEKTEGDIQRELQVVTSPLFINKAYAGKKFFFDSNHTQESKNKISEKAKKHRHTQETKDKMSMAQKNRPRQKASLATKHKMSIARKGRKQTPEFIERRIAPLRGKKRGPLKQEIKDLLKISCTGVRPSSFAASVRDGLRLGRGFDYLLTRGDEILIASSLKEFCKIHGYAYSSFIACFRSGKPHKKTGWAIMKFYHQEILSNLP